MWGFDGSIRSATVPLLLVPLLFTACGPEGDKADPGGSDPAEAGGSSIAACLPVSGLDTLGSAVRLVAEYSDLEADESGEHESGHVVNLWWSGEGRLLGLITAKRGGLVGDSPAGELTDLTFDPKDCSIRGTAKLSDGSVRDSTTGNWVPAHDRLWLSAIVRADSLLGTLDRTEEITGRTGSERLALPNDLETGATLAQWFESEAALREYLGVILEARGPKW